MGSHAVALGLSVLAYACARRYANDTRFAFGTWKIEILGGYTSALLLLCVAGLMAFQSIERLISPLPIHYNQAIALATVGLVVNLVCAWLLQGSHHHNHDHDHSHHHEHNGHQHQDLNLRAAYLHVLADAATSVLAIIALTGVKIWGAVWLDLVMGIVGAVLVAVWARGLLRDTSKVLLDAEMDAPVVEEIREVIATGSPVVEITDLHVWRVGRGKYSCVVALVAGADATPEHYRQALGIHEELAHVTVEINGPSA